MKQTFKFLTVFLLALLGASNLWATDYYIYVCPADVWGSDYDRNGVSINYERTNDGGWSGVKTMTKTGFKDGGKDIYGYKMTDNPNTGLKTLQFVNNNNYYGAGDWGNSADHVYHGHTGGNDGYHKWTDIPATSDASGVYLVGSFNNWTNEDSDFALTKQDGNHWTGTFILNGQSGNYEFKVYAKDSPMDYGYQFSGNGYHFNSTATTATQLWSNNDNDQIVCPASSGKFRIEVEYFGEYGGHGQLTVTSTIVKTLSFAKGNENATGTIPASQYLANGDKITLPANPFTLTGYDFAGWNDGSTTYAAGAEYTMGSSDKTLTAKWTAKEFSITLKQTNADSDKKGTESVTATYNEVLPSIATLPQRTGYSFGGYCLQSNSKVSLVNADGSWIKPVDSYIDANGKWIKATGTTLEPIWNPNSTTVTLKANGGTGDDQTFDVVFDSDINTTDKTAHTRTGYDLRGYFTAATNGSKILDENLAVRSGSSTIIGWLSSNNKWKNPNTTADLFAQWTAHTWTITLNDNEGTGGDVSKQATYGATTGITSVKVPTRENYSFAGYYDDQAGEGVQVYDVNGKLLTNAGSYTDGSRNWIYDNNVTLYAKWNSVGNYVVTLDNLGATSAGTTSVNVQINTTKGLTENITCPTKTGYTFGGYFTETGGSGTKLINADGSWIKPAEGYIDGEGKWIKNENVTLKAKWDANKTKVTFDKQGADTQGTSSRTPEYNSTQHLENISLPTRVGYTFGGYFTEQNGAGTQLISAEGAWIADVAGYTETSGDKIKWIKTTTAPLTLYAKWTPITYTINYEGNGNTGGSTASSEHTYDVEKALTTNGFTRAYTVTYDYQGATDGNTKTNDVANYTFAHWTCSVNDNTYTDGESVTNLASTQGEEVTMTAQWTSASVTLPTPVKTGYQFDGWYNNAERIGGAGESYTPEANVTLTAHWTAKTYTVTLDAQGGQGGSTSVTATYNAAMPSATMPTKLGYKFLGYYDEETDGTQYYNADGTSAKNWNKDQNNVTLYAHWVKMYFFIEGRFHVANAERTPHGAVWTNTFTSGDWATESRTIPMVWNETANRYEVHTFATPKELSTKISSQDPFFFIKASESATEWIGAKAYYAATDAARPLTTEDQKSAVGTEQKFFYFNSEDNSKWTILCYDAEGVYFVLEDIPTYYSINISVAEGDEDKGTVKPTVLHEINTLAYGTVKAESKDPQLYSFEKWGWKSSSQTKESFDFTNESGVILHDSCQSTWPEIRVNAAQTDLELIAHFKDRDIVTLYFVDSENWGNNIRMHLWGGFEQGTTWPGIMPNETDFTCNDHKVYSYTFDKGAYEKVKWSKNGEDKSSNFIIDSETSYYNANDGRWYDALSSVGPDKNICADWRVVFNNSDEYFKLVEGQTDIYECFLANVPEWEKEGDNWVKMRYKNGNNWEWRGFTGITNNQKVESYSAATYTASTSNSDQNQLNLAGFAGSQDFVMTFNTNTKELTIAYPTPKVEIGVKNKQGTVITESDIDSEEGFVLNAYPQNVDKDAQCTYRFQYKKDNGSWTTISNATAKSNTITDSQLEGPGVYKFKVSMTTGGKDYTSQETGNVTIYKYYWLALKEKDNGANWCKNIYIWGEAGSGTAYPGEVLTIKEGNWHFYKYKFPTYNKLKWNDGVKDNGSASGDITFDPNKLCHKITGSENKLWWVEQKDNCANCEDCPNRIYRDFPTNEYWISLDGTLTLTPTIRYYGSNTLNYSWSITSGNDKADLSSTNTKQTIVTPVAVGDAIVKFVVSDESGESHEYNITLHIINGTTIRVWKRYDDWTPIIHTWGTDDAGTDYEMKSEGNGWYSHTSSLNPVNFMVKKDKSTTNNYEKTLNVTNVTESGCWKVSEYKWNDGVDKDKHLIDKTEDCGLYYRVEETLADGKTTYHSNKVKKANEAVSFYAAKDGTLALQHYDEKENKYVDVKVIDNPDESNVQQATFTGNDIIGMTKYTGDYYIRTDGAKGGWNDYKQAGNKFTSFTRNPLFGNEKYNYYWVTTLKNGENAKAEVGNEINKCLAQTIDDYSCDKNVAANVRFGYCPETNYFTRAIIAGSDVADYLTLYGDNSTYFNGGEDNSTLYTDEQLTHKIYDNGTTAHHLKFKDLSDWVYEAEVYAAVDVTRPSDTKAVIKSHYNNLTDYLLGYDEKNERPAYAYTVLGNTSTKNMTFKITVTYDYKMNRLTTAWMPLAGEINGHLDVDAAIMFLNQVDVNDEVQQITVKDDKSGISSLNNIVYVMEFKETENVKGHTKETNHWISLPFDCRISDIYGIEGYVTLDNNKMPTDGVWGIQRYDGAARAQKGRMTQSDTYWTWMSRDEELNAGEGYVLSFDRGAIDWPEIEGTRTKRLYFQSKNAGFTLNLSKSDATQTVAEHEENASLHRYGEDANWNLIGPLAYNNININEWTGKEDAPKFLYEYLGKNAKYIEGIGKYRLVNPLEQTDGDKFEFVSFHSYMVQFAGTINWAQYTQTQQDNPATAPLLASADDEFTYTQVRLNLSKEGQQMDKTYVCLSEYGTTGYDLNDDLSKITEAKANQIGSVVENRIYAANTLPLETELVALYVNAAATGEYVIALNQENPYLQVTLLDAQTGMTTMLDDTDYTVTLNKGEHKDRFYLQLKQKGSDTPTSFDGKLEQYNLPTDKTQKLLINDQIYLINAGRIYNATGTKVK